LLPHEARESGLYRFRRVGSHLNASVRWFIRTAESDSISLQFKDTPMPLRAIAYVSEASAGLSSTVLDTLVDDAARFNIVAGVTGVLLFDGGRFLQYFEGPEDGLAAVHERILQARSHHGIVELSRGRVPQRYFPFWGMRWLGVEPALIRQLSAGDWDGFARRINDGAAVGSGLDRLLDVLAHTLPTPPAVSATR